MFKKLLAMICPMPKAQIELEFKLQTLNNELRNQRIQIQSLTDTLANKMTKASSGISKLAVSAHAVHRYKERHNAKGNSAEISKTLLKYLIEQMATMDTLPDGKYPLTKNVIGVVSNQTLVTVLPRNASNKLN